MFSEIFSNIPLYLLSLPVALLSLSIHETAHGYAAYKLGDPTAYNLGRLTLNPLKHIDPIGALCMVIFRVGWAKPVPINVRNFKKPRVGMAISAAAGPLSNLLLALLFALLLRLVILIFSMVNGELAQMIVYTGLVPTDTSFKLLCVLAYFLYMGIWLNISLMIFNLIPIPPFDGSRIAHLLLPAKWYFKIMQYERYIMLGMLLLFWGLSLLDIPVLSGPTAWVVDRIFFLFDFRGEAGALLNNMLYYVVESLAF